jgi:2-hydroxymuconate-semialdehyde hydrolase
MHDEVIRNTVRVNGGVLSVLACGTGEPVVLLHGIPTSAELWRDVAPLLARAGYRVLAPDLPGYGQTRLDRAADHSLAGAARLVATWLSEQDLAPAWVVGHDAGGAVAQILAVEHPKAIDRLTLVNSIEASSFPAPRARFATLVARAGLYRPAAWARLVPNPYVRAQVRRGLAEPNLLDAETARRVLWDGKFTDTDGRAAFQRHLAALTSRGLGAITPGLASLAIPCQLVWGAADPFQRWEVAGKHLQARLPAVAVTLLDDCGHFPSLECPDRLAAALLDWRSEHP